jgi:hypothetical protein
MSLGQLQLRYRVTKAAWTSHSQATFQYEPSHVDKVSAPWDKITDILKRLVNSAPPNPLIFTLEGACLNSKFSGESIEHVSSHWRGSGARINGSKLPSRMRLVNLSFNDYLSFRRTCFQITACFHGLAGDSIPRWVGLFTKELGQYEITMVYIRTRPRIDLNTKWSTSRAWHGVPSGFVPRWTWHQPRSWRRLKAQHRTPFTEPSLVTVWSETLLNSISGISIFSRTPSSLMAVSSWILKRISYLGWRSPRSLSWDHDVRWVSFIHLGPWLTKQPRHRLWKILFQTEWSLARYHQLVCECQTEKSACFWTGSHSR